MKTEDHYQEIADKIRKQCNILKGLMEEASEHGLIVSLEYNTGNTTKVKTLNRLFDGDHISITRNEIKMY